MLSGCYPNARKRSLGHDSSGKCDGRHLIVEATNGFEDLVLIRTIYTNSPIL